MKKLILLVLCVLLTPFSRAAGPTYGQHGMVLFGGSGGLYASHLPMFHAPHDYQVILRIRLADPALDAQLRRRLAARVALWTLAPEPFEIDRLAPAHAQALTAFKADIVQGHFEQGGVTRHAAAAVIVEQVLLFRQLDATHRRSKNARYLQVGQGAERFLVKQIDSRPDIDHIVAIRARPGTSTDALVVPKAGLSQPSSRQLAHALPGSKIRGTVYFYTEDLK
ncbi:hypothetical protein [Massilia sp. CF038]|uniref:hypothetical protein n=1 Tax=Massilia sp. CF038 TaxID=1881045 RepID=UPI000916C7A3|nr:hypothetical protein [Massilia sp. CF038]SHH28984.1 hypothetical protein SAMN05428948_3691 [Massilia sp. CF038]